MDNYIIWLTVNERIDVPGENDVERTGKVVKELLQLASRDLIRYNGWGLDRKDSDIDNQEDSDEPIGITQTHFYIRLAIDKGIAQADETEIAAYNYTIEALKFRPSVIISDYEREQEDLTQTYIEIKVGELNTDMA